MAGIVLQVEKRERTGTGGTRAVRGAVAEASGRALWRQGRSRFDPAGAQGSCQGAALGTISHLVEINDGGKKQQAIPRAIQFHPVTDEPIHVDLFRVDENTIINVECRLLQEPRSLAGLKRGGVLNIVSHTVSVATPATKIPEEFIVDLTGLEIGAVPHVSGAAMPEGVKPRVTRPRSDHRDDRRPSG